MAEIWIKFCGCTRGATSTLAVEAGADAFGMIFAPSPRRIALEAAQRDRAPHAGRRSSPVAVFVESADAEVDASVLDALSARARCSFPATSRRSSSRRYGERAIKAIAHRRPRDGDRRALRALFPTRCCSSIARTTAWPAARANLRVGARRRRLPRKRRVVVAGGLTPENVGACVERVRPFGVDVRSGIETDGRKDPQKMRAFVRAVRGAR